MDVPLRKKDEPAPEAKPAAPEAASANAKPVKRPGFLKRWVRWGLIIFIIIVAAAGWAFYKFGAGPAIKWAAEKYAPIATKAKVDIDKVEVSVFPPTITFHHIQAANRDKPMTNTAEVDKAVCCYDVLSLFLGRLYVSDMTVENLRFDTPRTVSGTLPGYPPQTAEEKAAEKPFFEKWLATLDIKKLDPEQMLRNENLESVRLAELTQKEVKEEKDKWQKKIADYQTKVEQYRKKFEELSKMTQGKKKPEDWLGQAGQAGEIAKAIEQLNADIKDINQARQDLQAVIAKAQKRVEEAQQAVPNDVKRLKDKYALTPEGLGAMAQTLLGEKIGGYVKTVAWGYKKAQPWLAKQAANRKAKEAKPRRAKGRDVEFPLAETAPPVLQKLPRVVIRKIHVSVKTKQGDFKGEIQNISDDPSYLGQPATLHFSAGNMPDLKSASLDGVFDHIDPAKTLDKLNLKVEGLGLKNMKLNGPLSLSEAFASLDLSAGVANGENLVGKLAGAFKSAKFVMDEKQSSNEAAKAIASALSGLKDFSLSADLTGRLEAPDIKVASPDFEKAISGAVTGLVQSQSGRLEAELQKAIGAKVSDKLPGIKDQLGGLASLDGQLGKIVSDLLGLSKSSTTGGLGGLLGGQKSGTDAKPGVQDALQGLGGLLGGDKAKTEEKKDDKKDAPKDPPKTETKPSPEEQLIRGLGGMLGGAQPKTEEKKDAPKEQPKDQKKDDKKPDAQTEKKPSPEDELIRGLGGLLGGTKK